jgi:hypothetical protein
MLPRRKSGPSGFVHRSQVVPIGLTWMAQCQPARVGVMETTWRGSTQIGAGGSGSEATDRRGSEEARLRSGVGPMMRRGPWRAATWRSQRQRGSGSTRSRRQRVECDWSGNSMPREHVRRSRRCRGAASEGEDRRGTGGEVRPATPDITDG